VETGAVDHRWRSPVLGDAKTLNLPHGELRHFDRGGGPTIVFTHGWLATGARTTRLPSGALRCPFLGSAGYSGARL
jgi:pimeloyl-ACP methyl ester carboxylesterase